MDPSLLMLSREVARERVSTAQTSPSVDEAEDQLYRRSSQSTITIFWRKVWKILRQDRKVVAHSYGG